MSFQIVVEPTPADARLAWESSQQLSKLLGTHDECIHLRVQSDKGAEETVALPFAAVQALADILTAMAKGNAVTLTPAPAEWTIRQAAAWLNVSRSYLIDLLDKGAIPYQQAGKRRRILFHDLLTYQRQEDQARLKALEELAALDQELEFGY